MCSFFWIVFIITEKTQIREEDKKRTTKRPFVVSLSRGLSTRFRLCCALSSGEPSKIRLRSASQTAFIQMSFSGNANAHLTRCLHKIKIASRKDRYIIILCYKRITLRCTLIYRYLNTKCLNFKLHRFSRKEIRNLLWRDGKVDRSLYVSHTSIRMRVLYIFILLFIFLSVPSNVLLLR